MNLPNKITLLRICFIPAFLFVFLAEPFGEIITPWLALVLFVTAAATDALDGYYARKLNLVTSFGKLMDPLADKILVSAAIIAFTSVGVLQAWVVVVIIAREFYVSGLRMLALEKGKVLAADTSGKVKTVFQIILIVYILLPPPFTILVHPIAINVLSYITAAIGLYSGINYTLANKNVF